MHSIGRFFQQVALYCTFFLVEIIGNAIVLALVKLKRSTLSIFWLNGTFTKKIRFVYQALPA